MTQPPWLSWAQQLQAIAQTGLTYSQNPFDLERYRQLRGIAVEIAASHLGASADEVRVAFASANGYPTPKVDVRSVVFRDQAMLLVRERSTGLWSIPGGWADVGHTIGEVAAKEVQEESGFRVHPVRILALYDRARHEHPPSLNYTYKVFVACALDGGVAESGIETDEVGFFDSDHLPPIDTERVTERQVRRMFGFHSQPPLSPDFD